MSPANLSCPGVWPTCSCTNMLTCHESNLRVVRAESRTPCIRGKTFGCSADGSAIWVSSCRGLFEFGSDPDRPERLSCGYPGMRRNSSVSCPLPRDEASDAIAHRQSRCVCFSSGPARGLTYSCPKPSGGANDACVGDTRGAEANARCCARPATKSCLAGWRACTWRSEERIAWFHPVKTGTSFLLTLAHYANRQCLSADGNSSLAASRGASSASANSSGLSSGSASGAKCKVLPEKADRRFLVGEKGGKCVLISVASDISVGSPVLPAFLLPAFLLRPALYSSNIYCMLIRFRHVRRSRCSRRPRRSRRFRLCRSRNGVEWERFFAEFKPVDYSRGSDVWWQPGIVRDRAIDTAPLGYSKACSHASPC